MKAMRKLDTKTVLGIIISLVGLYLGFRKFDSVAFFNSLKSTNLLIFGLSMTVMVFMVFLRAWRWRTLLKPLTNLSLAHSFGAEMIGYFGNNVFPFRLGEILRAFALGKITRTPTSAIFGTIVTERMLDFLVFIVILLTAAIFYPQMPVAVRYSAVVATIIILILGILLYISNMKKQTLKNYFRLKFGVKKPKSVVDLLCNFWRGLNTLRHTPQIGLIVTQSIIIWLVCLFNTWLSGIALQVNFNIPTVLLIFFVTSAIISIPSAPGYVGTYHAATIGTLVLLGYDLAKSQALAVILHAVGFISLTAIGLFYFIKYQIDFKHTADLYVEKGADI